MTNTRWDDVRRLEAWAGEARVNLVRVAALIGFYGQHLLTLYVFRDDPTVDLTFHKAVTALVMMWALLVVAVQLTTSRRWMPAGLMYGVVLWDLALCGAMVIVADGPRSPLLVLFLLVIFSATLRLSQRLVLAATVGGLAGYLWILGFARWWRPDMQAPRNHQVIFAVAILSCGLLAWQAVRQAQRLVEGYPLTVIEEDDEDDPPQPEEGPE